MTILQSGSIASTGGGYQIERSLRFNSADLAYLNRTLTASSTSSTTYAWSAWVKRSTLASARALIGYHGNTAGTGNMINIEFVSDTLRIYFDGAGSTGLQTTAVYRDPSAWYHIVLVYDSTQTTPSNRAKLYVNGVQVTVFSSANYPALNQAINAASTNIQLLGATIGPTNFFNGYMTEINFIDGYPTGVNQGTWASFWTTNCPLFGQTNASTGVWEPIAYSGTYGTNGFYLKFADNSGTTSTTLGKDSSGNGNNWTPNNFSVTAGAGNDSLVDSPTSYGTDTGAGGEVRGNYCTLNPLDKTAAVTLSNGNLQALLNGINYFAKSTIAISSGKWYWEVTASATAEDMIGITKADVATTGYFGSQATSYGYYKTNGNKYNSATGTAYGASYASGDIIGVALDLDAGTLTYYKNGVSQGTAFTGLSGTFFAGVSTAGTGGTQTINFGQRPFEKWNGSAYVANTAPSGFKALCTQNLPTPTIGATSTTQANDYFNTVIWTGNGTNPRSITGVGFQPDFTWGKARSSAYSNTLFDAVRGAGSTKALSSNVTDAEGLGVNATDSAVAGYITSFDSDGFSVQAGSSTNNYWNTNAVTYVSWNWKANGAGSTNSNGTAKNSSVTVDSGTDTVTWNSHGMSDGQKIGFFAATMPGGLSAGTLYYVRDAATNTFKVAASSGGAAIDITSNGTTVTAHTTLTSTVSANTTSGFSIVTYTGSGSNATVEHGLGVAPRMIIHKCRGTTSTNWPVYHVGIGNTAVTYLNSTIATSTTSAWLNNTSPTSTVWTIGTDGDINGSTRTYVAYCFTPVAGYSAFGSYTGNGAVDGTFVYTGFRPRYVLMKSSTQTSPWQVFDTARDLTNVSGYVLLPNSTATDTSFFATVDILSNGFKLRYNGDPNTSAQTYIYAAFAEHPFKYSLAR